MTLGSYDVVVIGDSWVVLIFLVMWDGGRRVV